MLFLSCFSLIKFDSSLKFILFCQIEKTYYFQILGGSRLKVTATMSDRLETLMLCAGVAEQWLSGCTWSSIETTTRLYSESYCLYFWVWKLSQFAICSCISTENLGIHELSGLSSFSEKRFNRIDSSSLGKLIFYWIVDSSSQYSIESQVTTSPYLYYSSSSLITTLSQHPSENFFYELLRLRSIRFTPISRQKLSSSQAPTLQCWISQGQSGSLSRYRMTRLTPWAAQAYGRWSGGSWLSKRLSVNSCFLWIVASRALRGVLGVAWRAEMAVRLCLLSSFQSGAGTLVQSNNISNGSMRILIVVQIDKNKMKKISGSVVCKNLAVKEKLGTGSFGEIYLAESRTNRQQYAIKFQDVNVKHPQLFYEAKLYKALAGATGVPKIYAITTEGSHNLMVMQLLGLSLEDLFQKANKRISVKSALMTGLQMLDRIQCLHEKGYLHRDIKPDNFLVGRADNSLIYMIDLGLAKRYTKDGIHIPYCTGKELTGTARYASINTHMGYQQGRRDDIQSIGYVVVYLARGSLPWQNLKAQEKKSKYDLIRDRKLGTSVEVLCHGLPKNLAAYVAAAKSLKFEEKPDYAMFKQLLKEALKEIDAKNDKMFDWVISQSYKTVDLKDKTSTIDQFFQTHNQKIEQKKLVQKIMPPRPTQTAKLKLFQPPVPTKQTPIQKLGSTGNIRRSTQRNSSHKRKEQSIERKWQGPRITVIKQ